MTTTLKLTQLLPDTQCNSRYMRDEDALRELIASIEVNGLILPISVRPTESGRYLIIDGHRRFEALTRIHGDKSENVDVPVLVRDADDKDARVLSLAANIMRLPLHPADQYEAFAKMRDEGLSEQEIATRFALPVKDVQQRLALGNLIPGFLDAYRAENLTLDILKKLTPLSKERQCEVYQQVANTMSDWAIRNVLNDNAIYDQSSIAQFVGLEAYLQAGGRVERSLFEERVKLIDTELLTRLAQEKVPGWCDERKADGWFGAYLEDQMPKGWSTWKRHYADTIYTEDQIVRRAEIEKRIDEIDETDADELSVEEDDKLNAERNKLENELDQIDRDAPQGWTADEKAESVIVLTKDWRITGGYIWPKKEAKPEEGAAPSKPEVKPWSQALVDEIESYGTVACQLAIMREHDLADAMLLTTLYMDAIPTSTSKPFAFSSVDKFADVENNAGPQIQAALKSFKLKGASFENLLPQIVAMDANTRSELRSALTARILKKRRGKELEAMFKTVQTADIMATWKPEKEFFERLNVKQLEEIHRELTGAGFNTPTTKQSAVAMVVTQASARNWMPKLLRAGMSSLDTVKLDNNLEQAKKRSKPKGVPKTTVVGEDGKTEKKGKKAA